MIAGWVAQFKRFTLRICAAWPARELRALKLTVQALQVKSKCGATEPHENLRNIALQLIPVLEQLRGRRRGRKLRRLHARKAAQPLGELGVRGANRALLHEHLVFGLLAPLSGKALPAITVLLIYVFHWRFGHAEFAYKRFYAEFRNEPDQMRLYEHISRVLRPADLGRNPVGAVFAASTLVGV